MQGHSSKCKVIQVNDKQITLLTPLKSREWQATLPKPSEYKVIQVNNKQMTLPTPLKSSEYQANNPIDSTKIKWIQGHSSE